MRRSLSLLGGLGLGLALSQFPEYAQQYTQRLGGAVDELQHVTEEFDAAARAGGLTREQALTRYENSTDSFLSGRGTSMERTFVRYDMLKASLAEIQGADPLDALQAAARIFRHRDRRAHARQFQAGRADHAGRLHLCRVRRADRLQRGFGAGELCHPALPATPGRVVYRER